MTTAEPEEWAVGSRPEQKAAAAHEGSNARLLAGPGTGKTLTLRARVAFLVLVKRVEPEQITALTVTRAAAAELRSRVEKALEGKWQGGLAAGAADMDSPHPSRVYDEEVIAASGTNADVINDLLRDLPVQRIKEAAGPYWHRHEEIRQLKPDLVLVHFSAFCTEVCEDDRVKMRALYTGKPLQLDCTGYEGHAGRPADPVSQPTSADPYLRRERAWDGALEGPGDRGRVQAAGQGVAGVEVSRLRFPAWRPSWRIAAPRVGSQS